MTNRLKCERPIKAKSFINDLELSVSFISQQRRRANAQLTHLQIWETELFPLPSSNTENFIVKCMSLERITAHANLQRSCVNTIRKEASSQNGICCQDRWEQLSPLITNNNFFDFKIRGFVQSCTASVGCQSCTASVGYQSYRWFCFQWRVSMELFQIFLRRLLNKAVWAYKEHSCPRL